MGIATNGHDVYFNRHAAGRMWPCHVDPRVVSRWQPQLCKLFQTRYYKTQSAKVQQSVIYTGKCAACNVLEGLQTIGEQVYKLSLP